MIMLTMPAMPFGRSPKHCPFQGGSCHPIRPEQRRKRRYLDPGHCRPQSYLCHCGYTTRGNPIIGLVVGNDNHGNPESSPKKDAMGLPYTILAYANGRGYRGPMQNNKSKEITTSGVHFHMDIGDGGGPLPHTRTGNTFTHPEALGLI